MQRTVNITVTCHFYFTSLFNLCLLDFCFGLSCGYYASHSPPRFSLFSSFFFLCALVTIVFLLYAADTVMCVASVPSHALVYTKSVSVCRNIDDRSKEKNSFLLLVALFIACFIRLLFDCCFSFLCYLRRNVAEMTRKEYLW
ncbi:hypothetical protein, unlikely [Trypanosoma congolense IL3000]|uniref:Uncharacterized protein n=1 Tax=Trypanosoma congolense (strain IL3000) TaxID=1068625 RepID=F9WCK4_TRYCI|nr:hypothetical protein, unlikely [Trypanosoma congolense IL3000]